MKEYLSIVVTADEYRAASKGNKAATDKIVRKHYSFIRASAKKFAKKYNRDDIDELTQEGALGILHAIKKFEVDRGWQFLTYAQHWVRAVLSRYCQRPALVPTYRYRKKVSMREFRMKDDDFGDDGIAVESADERILHRELYEEINRVVHGRDKELIQARLAGQILEQCAATIGITREGARLIEKKVTEKLRRTMT